MPPAVRETLVSRMLVSGLVSAIAIGFGCLAGCGGGGSSSSSGSSGSGGAPAPLPPQTIASAAPNVATMEVDCGPSSICGTQYQAVNFGYVTVTVCIPGNAAECQTFNNIQVDTQSYGLRLVADATDVNGNALTVALPVEDQNESGEPLAECAVFADGYSWGPLDTADVTVSGETTQSAVPVQIIGSASYSSVPADCQDASVDYQEDSVETFGANGVLGVGPFVQDCGEGCAPGGGYSPTYYYTCPTPTSCADSDADVDQQVSNPVWYFLADNNGVIVELPPISASGAATATGALVFGIGTEDNNGLGSATVYQADPNSGYITTTFNGASLTGSIIDSGSNGLFFTDSSINPCSKSSGDKGFYCPNSTLDLSATIASCEGCASDTSITVGFEVANPADLDAEGTAFNDLAGGLGSGFPTEPGIFDWGLPFFFGRNVFTAIYPANTPAGEGPYYAF